MPFVATNGFKTKTTSFYWDQSLLTTMEWKYSAMWNLVSAVLSIRLFLLQEKSMIYHLGGRDKENLGGGGGNTWLLGGVQSTPIYYKEGGTKENRLPINFQ